MTNSYKEIVEIFYHQKLFFIPKAIQTELISHYYNNLLAGYFGIKKTYKLLAQKYYLPTFCHNVKAHVKSYDVCLTSKAVRHKPYSDLQLLSILIYQ